MHVAVLFARSIQFIALASSPSPPFYPSAPPSREIQLANTISTFLGFLSHRLLLLHPRPEQPILPRENDIQVLRLLLDLPIRDELLEVPDRHPRRAGEVSAMLPNERGMDVSLRCGG